MTARPRVRVNQLGYLLDRPKHATLVSNAKDPLHFTVRDQSGIVVFAGLSEPWSVQPEPTSGLMVHVLDFSNLDTPGAGFCVEAVAQRSQVLRVMRMLSPSVWIIYLVGTHSVRATSPGMAPTTAVISGSRQFGHDLNPALPPPPRGALAGGANSRPAPDFPYDSRLVGLPSQCCYIDEPTSEVTNDVCIRWNAPLTWIATYLSIADGLSS